MMIRIAIVLLVCLSAMVAWLHQQTRPEPLPTRTWSLDALLGDAPDGFERVVAPKPFAFPSDHAMHPSFRNEWWYFTGRIDAPDRPMGFQFTLFRFGMRPPLAEHTDTVSEWASDHLWMAHLALSDGGDGDAVPPRFYQAERFARDTLGLAGATEQRWWLRDWEVISTPTGWQLKASAEDFALDLMLEPTRQITLQGDQGFSQKGPEVGNASYYYSLTRLDTTGTVTLHRADPLAQETLSVQGLSWLDREWGSGQLSKTQSGWDWFAIHLDDGRDLMLYRLRNLDNTASEFSAGVLVDATGESTGLTFEDFQASPVGWWEDDQGVAWPVRWQIEVPNHNLSLIVEPLFEHQRWNQSVAYWEGAIDVYQASTRVGRGYLELSGYAE